MDKDMFSLKGKIAVVTGGSGLIGKEIVKGLGLFGAAVYVADQEIKDSGSSKENSKVKSIKFDISSESSIREMVGKITKESGRIDILINSAYPRTGDWSAKLPQVSFDSWKENVNSHLGGYFLCCQKVAEKMKDTGGGTIINIASIYGALAPDFSVYEGTEMTMPVAYSAIKGGIISLTKYLATYYAKNNIRANTVSPGGIFDDQDEVFVKNYSNKTPLKRMGKPGEIVGAVIFLASDASSYITGHNLIVDGGWSAW